MKHFQFNFRKHLLVSGRKLNFVHLAVFEIGKEADALLSLQSNFF